MRPVLRLFEDVISGGIAEIPLPAAPRMIFVVHGAVAIDGHSLGDGETWHGEGPTKLRPSPGGVTCWRWELSTSEAGQDVLRGDGIASHEKVAGVLETLPTGELLLRGDSVAFPPGGCAYLHTHQGPGIRCLIEGGMRIDSHGRSTSYGPGGAWYEAGPEPVFAQAAADRPSRFIRVLILPRALIGKSSIQYVNEDDKTKPKSQSYKVFVDLPIAFRKAS